MASSRQEESMRAGSVWNVGCLTLLMLGFAIELASCSSSGGGASPGTAGTSGGAGTTGSGGGGHAGSGGGAAGQGGSAGSAAGSAGVAGSGGAAGAGGSAGGAAWALTSPDFASGAAMPSQFTCDGHDFASG